MTKARQRADKISLIFQAPETWRRRLRQGIIVKDKNVLFLLWEKGPARRWKKSAGKLRDQILRGRTRQPNE